MTGKELMKIRLKLGLTQRQLAERVGIASNNIAKQERGILGISEPVARLIRVIAAGVDVEKIAHTGSSRRASSPKPTQGSGTALAKGKNRRGSGQNSVQRVRRARIRKK